jgi:MFS superfamily sulfate permease-like transporter
LCQPKVWRHVAHIGSEQLLVFCTTVLVTVTTDLLIGIIAGMVLEFVLNVSFAWPAARVVPATAPALAVEAAAGGARTLSRFTGMFRNPVTNRELVDDQYHMYFDKPLVSFNSLYLNRELTRIPEQATTVCFHLSDDVTLIDHSASSQLMGFARDFQQSGKGRIQFTGLEEMFKCSDDETCVRLGARTLTGTARGGVGNLVAKARNSLFTGRRTAGRSRPDRHAASPAPSRFASGPEDDLGFLSLSSSGEIPIVSDREDVSRLGPAPKNGDAGSELGRLSLTCDGPAPLRHPANN